MLVRRWIPTISHEISKKKKRYGEILKKFIKNEMQKQNKKKKNEKYKK